jgi:hypothetical protein
MNYFVPGNTLNTIVKKVRHAGRQWLIPIATWEAEIGKIKV